MPLRVLVDSDATITGPIFTDANEEALDTTGTPTVAVVSRVTGDTLTAPTVTAETGAGIYTCALTAAAHTGEVDILDLTWTGTVASKTRTYRQTVEVVGGFYLSVPELRQTTTLASASTRSADQLRKFRTEGEDIIETARGVAYVPRCAVETFGPDDVVRLRHRRVRSLLAVRVDGVDQDVADYEVDPVTRIVSGSLPSSATVVVAYSHGYTTPPLAATEALREYVRAKAVMDSSSANRNPSSVTNLATGETYRFTTADARFGRFTGIEEVDARINMLDDERVFLA